MDLSFFDEGGEETARELAGLLRDGAAADDVAAAKAHCDLHKFSLCTYVPSSIMDLRELVISHSSSP